MRHTSLIYLLYFCLSGNCQVTVRWAGLVPRWVTVRGVYHLGIYPTSLLGRISLAILGRRNEYWQWLWSSLGKKRPSNLTAASCDLDLWPAGPKADRFTPLPRGPLVPICIEIGPHYSKYRIHKFADRRTNEGKTDRKHYVSCQVTVINRFRASNSDYNSWQHLRRDDGRARFTTAVVWCQVEQEAALACPGILYLAHPLWSSQWTWRSVV